MWTYDPAVKILHFHFVWLGFPLDHICSAVKNIGVFIFGHEYFISKIHKGG